MAQTPRRPHSVAGSPAADAQIPAAVLWDMDGTLLDSEKLWTISLSELTEQLGGSMSAADRASLVGSNTHETLKLLFAAAGRPFTPETAARARRYINDRMAELYRSGPLWQPGAVQALAEVRAAGLPSALVTTTERELAEVALDTIGREFFDVTVCGDEVDGQNKPHPEPYRKAARLLGVHPGDCVAVEDSPTGTASAAAAGAVVLVVPSETPVPAGPRRVFRDSLEGVDADFFADLVLTGQAADDIINAGR